jgi:hypothetical protein
MILTLNFRHNTVRRVEVDSIPAAEAFVQEGKDRGHFIFQGEKGQSEQITACRLEIWDVRETKPKTYSNRRIRPRVASDALFEEK